MEFKFKGRSCRAFGLEYVPKASELRTGIPGINITDLKPAYHHGGYYFGYNAQPRQFSIECYYEEQQASSYERMMMWMAPGESGQLVFEDRPLVHYDAVVTDTPKVALYPAVDEYGREAESATVTFTLTAYEPFGKLTVPSSPNASEVNWLQACSGWMPIAPNANNDYTDLGTFLVHNPGSFESDTIMRIGGALGSAGLTITNRTNGDVCKLLELPPSPNYLELDSLTGRVQYLPAYPDGVYYSMHDDGFIRLAPSWPYTRRVTASYTSGSNVVSFQADSFTKDDEGLYIYLDSQWLRIANVSSEHTIVVSQAMESTDTEWATVTLMNEIQIAGTGATLTKFDFEFTPYVR